jgi:MFS family permease
MKPKLLLPLRHREFRLLWIGMTVSLLGDGVTLVAVAWKVYQISNSPSALATVMIAMSVPHVLLLLIGGAVSDRFDRRRVMLAADSIRGAALLVLASLALSGVIQVWHVMVVMAFYGAGTAFFGPAFDAIVPELVPEEELPLANSLEQLVRPGAARLLGPAFGGLLIALAGPGLAFLLDAGTFGVSIACLLSMRPGPRPRAAEDPDEQTSTFDEIREGFRFIRSHRWLWGTFAAATFAYLVFLGPSEVLLPFVVKNVLHASAGDLGLVLAMGGVGAIGASLVVGQRGIPRRQMTFMYATWTLSTLMVVGYGVARSTWQLMVACLLFNALESAGLIAWITTKQVFVPRRMLGRVSSLDWFISIGLMPLSYALTGPIAAVLGVRATLVVAGLLGGAITLTFLFLPGMREVEGLPGSALDHDAPVVAEFPSPIVDGQFMLETTTTPSEASG